MRWKTYGLRLLWLSIALVFGPVAAGRSAMADAHMCDYAAETRLIGIINGQFVTIDKSVGWATDWIAIEGYDGYSAATAVDTIPFAIVDGWSRPKLALIDTSGITATVVADIALPGEPITIAESAAYCPCLGVIYVGAGAGAVSSRLLTIHPFLGTVAQVATFSGMAQNDADALEVVGGVLYAVDSSDGWSLFYRVDATTGQATLIGEIGYPNVNDIAYDLATDTMFGVSSSQRQLIAISLSDGHGELVGATHTADEHDGGLVQSLAIVRSPPRSVYLPYLRTGAH